MTNPFASRELTPTTGPYGPTPIASPNKVPAPVDPNTLHMEGPLPSQVDFDANLTVEPVPDAPEPTPSTTETAETAETVETYKPEWVERRKAALRELSVLNEEANTTMDGIRDDALELYKATEGLPVNPDKSSADEPSEITVDLRNGETARARVFDAIDVRDGLFVGTDDKKAELTTITRSRHIDAIDPNDVEAVKAMHGGGTVRQMLIKDPSNPKLLINLDPEYPNTDFGIEHLTGDDSDQVDGRVNVRRNFSGKVSFEYDLEGEKNIGDPFDVVRKTLDFAKSATLKPAIPAAPAPIS